MPAVKNHNGVNGIPLVAKTRAPVRNFSGDYSPYFEEKNFIISGVSRDSAGAALGSCLVYLFNWTTFLLEQTQTSDGSGNYSFTVNKNNSYRIVSTKAGPNIAGATADLLVGA